MSINATYSCTISYAGDISFGPESFADANNNASPGQIQIINLALGDNTITPPTGGTTPVGVVIFPPASNAIVLTLKGVGADTGIQIHKTLQTKLSLNSPTGTFVLNAASALTGMRLIWI
jgi:hypothetical protein